jgi:YbbR domain-containing protein
MAYSPFRNVGLKFLSICIAALLWLVVAGDRVVERAIRVPIEFQNLPQGLEIVGDPMEGVDVRLRGSSGALGRLGPGDTSAVIDLRNARPGRRLFHITATQIKVPYGLDVVQIAPATLPITFENSAVRVVQVRPSVEGRPAPGYEVGGVTTDPATVEVIGPESALRGLDEAMTEPVSIANATRPIREIVTVGVADPAVHLRSPQTAVVTVQIAPGQETKTLAAVPIEIRNLDNGLRGRTQPPTVAVTLRGTTEALRELTAAAVTVHVDADGARPGDKDLEVQVQSAPGITIASVIPRWVRLRVGARE